MDKQVAHGKLKHDAEIAVLSALALLPAVQSGRRVEVVLAWTMVGEDICLTELSVKER